MKPSLSWARTGRALLWWQLHHTDAFPDTAAQQSFSSLKQKKKTKKNMTAFVTFTPAKHFLVDTQLDMLGSSLEISTMTITNLKWVILRGMWCPRSTGWADRTESNIPGSPPDLRQQLLGSSSQLRGRRKGKAWATYCWVLCCVNKYQRFRQAFWKNKKKAHSKHLMRQDYTYTTPVPGLTSSLVSKDTSLKMLCTQIY